MVVDRAIQEHDEACREAEARRANLGVEVARRLDAKEVSTGLRTDLAEARRLLQVKGDEYDRLSSAVLAVCDDLRVTQEEGDGSLAVHAASITACVGQLEESAFCLGITQAFTVAHSHYAQEINLGVMSQGFAPVYEDAELDEMEKVVAPLARNLADKLKEEVLPSWK